MMHQSRYEDDCAGADIEGAAVAEHEERQTRLREIMAELKGLSGQSAG
jgi:hypothetical protein